ncbi:MAG: hypothetical protein K2W99_01925 [Chthoniobacterales bacterium]|nr:hypothetical protein [Chthoniobacterales bacterium]
MAHSYVERHHTTLDQLMRDLLKQKVMPLSGETSIDRLFALADKHPSQLENYKFNREEIYDL